ncbi:DUF6702 family protein [Pedobacter deserti]|uniref:DUF6702 family protein n=1 Tax=Pedobacter deserti TaxID=2817382 RepID=UPI00210AE8BE|nr:DUF6702 family protein [Pedobacter sp. SYSU D00382]
MILSILLIFFKIFHPFYVSVTEITQDEKTMAVQVSARIFFDDLEAALNKKYKTNVSILKPADKKQVNALISAYIKDHLKIKVNNTDVALSFVGYEIEEEAAWCYFESAKVPPIRQLRIHNDILFEQHSAQINMIHAIIKGKRQSTKLDNPKTTVNFLF